MAVELIELGRRCARGKILRKSYTRKDGTVVASKCVTDTGKPGKTPKAKRVLPPIKPGTLTCDGRTWKHGDHYEYRMRVLRCLVVKRRIPCATVIRDLNLLANYTGRTSPETRRAAREDMHRLREETGCRLKSKQNGRSGR